MPLNDRSCLFEINGNDLYFANAGQPFSRLGVVAICAFHLGTKHDYKPTDPDKYLPDSKLIEAIRNREMNTYKANPDRIISDFRGEEETKLDYGGRAIWELLQNADDAMAPVAIKTSQLIGTKGLGFKSVLEISAEPEIHSGEFHFHFSPDKLITLLQDEGISASPPSLTFRMPFKKEPDETAKKLLEKYSTVIKLPLKDNKKDEIIKWLKKFDFHTLLLCKHIKELEIKFNPNEKYSWTINRKHEGELSDCDIYVEFNKPFSVVPKKIYFRRWAKTWYEESDNNKYHSVAICLPLSNTDQQPIPTETQLPLHVFFPTKEKLPFNAVIHASFDLESNRKHIRRGESDEQILDALAELVKRIVNDSMPAETTLRAFVPEKMPDDQELSGRIWTKFKDALQNEAVIPVIGGYTVTPVACNIWKYNIGKVIDKNSQVVCDSKLVIPEVLNNSSCEKALVKLEAHELRQDLYPELLKNCLNNSIIQCREAFECLFAVVKKFTLEKSDIEKCREIPCWWTNNNCPRPLNCETPLFKTIPDIEIPQWLPLDCLDEDILNDLEVAEKKKNYKWSELIEKFLLESTNDNFLHKSLIPFIEKKESQMWWEDHGKYVLKLFKKWAPEKNSEAIIWKNERMVRMGAALRIPTDKGWLPAIYCYAGSSWGGHIFIEDFFKDIDGRGVILPPEKWPISIDTGSWNNLLKLSGTSWSLKLVYWNTDDKSGRPIKNKGYMHWKSECPFQQGVDEDLWERYWKKSNPPSYYDVTEFDFNASVNQQWAIEYFPDCLPEDTEDRLRLLEPIARQAIESKMRYAHEKRGYYGLMRKFLPSFASWQLKYIKWMPCRPSLFYLENTINPEKAYMPGKGLRGLLPEINITISDGQEGRNLETLLTQILGVRETLPDSSSEDWMRWAKALPDAVERQKHKKDLKNIVKTFYKRLLILPEKPENIDLDCKVPFIYIDQDIKTSEGPELLDFKRPEEMYWLDKHFFAEPATRSEILKKFKIFLMELDAGAKAVEWFGIRRLSEAVDIEPRYRSEQNEVKNEILTRYEERQRFIKAIDRQLCLNLSKIQLKVVKDLKLSIIYSGKEIASPRVSAWKSENTILMDADDKWHSLAYAITLHRKKEQADLLENLFRVNSIDEVLERMRERGISTDSLDYLEGNETVEHIVEIDKTDIQLETGERFPNDKKKVDTKEGEFMPPVEGMISPKTDIKSAIKAKAGNTGGYVDQTRREKGQEAEDWMRGQLRNRLNDGWNVSPIVDRDEQNRESDILVQHEHYGTFHIEVKHMKTDSIWWSYKEVSKAYDNPGRYFMVVCCPSSIEFVKYNEYWLKNPLKELLMFKRTGRWIWDRKHKDIDFIPIEDEWKMPKDAPSMKATNFSYQIKVLEHELKKISIMDFEKIRLTFEKNV